jgi:hypothetical protein
MRSKVFLAAGGLAAALVAGVAFPPLASAQTTAPTVSGVSGCIVPAGGGTKVGGGTTLNPNDPDVMLCNPNGTTTYGDIALTGGNFATVGSVNSALQNLQTQINTVGGGPGGITSVSADGTTIVGNGVSTPLSVAPAIINQITTNTANITSLNTRTTVLETSAVRYQINADGTRGNVVLGGGTGGTAPVRVSNMAAGGSSLDAVNVAQLQSALAGLGGGAAVNPDGSVTGPTYVLGSNTYTNVNSALTSIYQNGSRYLKANSTAAEAQSTGTRSVALGGAAVASHDRSVALGEGSVTDRANSVSVGAIGSERQITNVAAGTRDTDAANVGQIRNGISYDIDNEGNRIDSVTLNSQTGGSVRIRNVAYGVAPTDAANVQNVRDGVAESKAYTDSQFGYAAFANRQTRREARAGVSLALATAALRYDDQPGKYVLAAGMGYFQDSTALAAGLGYTTQNGAMRFNAAFGYAPASHKWGMNAGASWALN